MDLQPYLTAVSEDLARATALADEHTRDVAGRVATAIEPALRLALTQALSDAAAHVTAELDGAVVTIGMEGRDPVIRVQDMPGDHAVSARDIMMTSPLALSGPLGSSAEGDPADPADGAADPTGGPADPARVTVRLPEQLKRRAESLAVDADQSLNTWIVQAIRRATTPPPDPTPQHGRSRRVTGWA